MDNAKYFRDRTTQLGFNEEKHFAHYSIHPDEPVAGKAKQPLLWPDKEGNICIGYLGLDGELKTEDVSKAKSKINIQPIYWMRYKKPRGEQRYGPCRKGIGVLYYFCPQTAEAYAKGKHIKRLVITEGPLKALKAYIDEIGHVTAIPSITIWKPKYEHRVFQEMRMIIERCKVKEILYLTDGDTLTIKYEPGKDLSKRPYSFYRSVRTFKKLCEETGALLYYGHINEDQPKGLDDLLIENPDDKDQIRKELFHTPEEFKYMTINDITDWSPYRMLEYFGIQDKAEHFYQLYGDFIKMEEFVFKQGLYKYDEQEEKIVYLKMGESARFERIGKTFYIQGTKPTKRETLENVLIPITQDEIKHMYKKEKSDQQIKQIIRDIDYYNGALNVPSHHNYQKCIKTYDENGNVLNWYNIYRKLTHTPQEGSTKHSLSFIKHIFGEEDIEHRGKVFKSYELGLDYIKLLWERPQQILPILCLVSKHRHTGKTTFWNWMRVIFQQNVRFVRVEHLTGQFTSYFASSLLVVIDEALIDKKNTMERVKALVTAETFTMEAKHQNAEEVNNFVKVGLSSNNINNFAHIDEDEVRFWVREVNPIPEDDQNFKLLEDLENEIPAFLHYLEEREMATNFESRAWFNHQLLKTEALERVVKKSRSGKELTVESAIIDHMKTVERPVLKLSSKDIRDLIGINEISVNDIRWVVEDKWGYEKCKSARQYTLYAQSNDYVSGSFVIEETNKRSLFYTFPASKFMTIQELFEIYDSVQLIELENELLELGEDSFWKAIEEPHVISSLKNYQWIRENKKDVYDKAIESIIDKEYSTFRDFESEMDKHVAIQ